MMCASPITLLSSRVLSASEPLTFPLHPCADEVDFLFSLVRGPLHWQHIRSALGQPRWRCANMEQSFVSWTDHTQRPRRAWDKLLQRHSNTVQRRTAVNAYFSSKQLLLFAFALHCFEWCPRVSEQVTDSIPWQNHLPPTPIPQKYGRHQDLWRATNLPDAWKSLTSVPLRYIAPQTVWPRSRGHAQPWVSRLPDGVGWAIFSRIVISRGRCSPINHLGCDILIETKRFFSIWNHHKCLFASF